MGTNRPRGGCFRRGEPAASTSEKVSWAKDNKVVNKVVSRVVSKANKVNAARASKAANKVANKVVSKVVSRAVPASRVRWIRQNARADSPAIANNIE